VLYASSGATSTDKFKKFIEKDVALERRFQQVGAGSGSLALVTPSPVVSLLL
jgi:ATP-dependent Clp protease ATP-binding subunit ClpA